MIKLTGLIICLLLTAQVLGQSTCSVSNLDGIASGVINLGVPNAPLAQTTYTQTLSGFNLGVFAQVFHAFAIAGFQAPSNQQFYSLVVDQVVFSNGNTQMNVTMNYLYNSNGINYQTSWTKVKLSWMASSTGFQTVVVDDPLGGNYIWAGSVGLSAPFTDVSGAIMTNSPFIPQTGDMDNSPACGYINSSPGFFDLTCNTFPNSRFVTHSYIMGFQFNPSGTFTLAASAIQGNGGTVAADANEALLAADIVHVPSGGVTTLPLTGPKLLIEGFGSQLQYVKVAIVITTILDITTYPTSNTAKFSYSGIYMKYTLYNQANPLQQAPNANDGNQNYNYFSLLKAKYEIYGLSSFRINTLPADVTVVDYDINFPDINTIQVQSNNVNYINNVRVAADRWNSLINSCSASTTIMFNIQQKSLTTVPSFQVGQQSIHETSSRLDFVYNAASIGDPTTPLSASIVFTNSLFFEKFTPNMAYRLAFRIANKNIPGVNPGTTIGYSSLSASTSIQYTISIQGNQIVSQVRSTDLTKVPTGTDDIWEESIGYIFTTPNPVVTLVINVPRDSTNGIRF